MEISSDSEYDLSSEEEEEDEDDSQSEEQQLEPYDDSHKDNDDPGAGTYRCPECEYDTCRYGERAFSKLRTHAKHAHIGQEEAILEKSRQLYARGNRHFKTEGTACELCGSIMQGNITHMRRHQLSTSCKKLANECASKRRKTK